MEARCDYISFMLSFFSSAILLYLFAEPIMEKGPCHKNYISKPKLESRSWAPWVNTDWSRIDDNKDKQQQSQSEGDCTINRTTGEHHHSILQIKTTKTI